MPPRRPARRVPLEGPIRSPRSIEAKRLRLFVRTHEGEQPTQVELDFLPSYSPDDGVLRIKLGRNSDGKRSIGWMNHPESDTTPPLHHETVPGVVDVFSGGKSTMRDNRISLNILHYGRRFRQTQSLPPDNSARIFLDSGGFKAWLAHFLITTGEAHYSGREARQRLLRELETLPSEERARIAQEVSASTVHPSAQAHVREMEHQALAQTAVAGVAGRKRRRQDEPLTRGDEDHPASPSLSTPAASDVHRVELHSEDTTHWPVPVGFGLSEAQGQVVSGASIPGLLSVFPDYISGAIRRDGHGDHVTAAVTMNFPGASFGGVPCIMTLVVEPNKVERLAMLLFRAHLETTGESRELVLESGTRTIPKPQLLLQGSPSDAVSQVFGPEIAGATAATPFRKREVFEGIRATRCVTMTIPHESNSAALITLTLGLEEGIRIQGRLYNRDARQ